MLHIRPTLDHPARPDTRDVQALRRALSRMEDENRELKSRLEAFLPSDDLRAARRVFGMTPAEAAIFLILVRRGVATYEQIERTIYSIDKLEIIDRLDEAIRSHIKRLRKKLRPHGIEFETVYGLGFECEEPMRDKGRAMLLAARKAVPA